MRSLTKPSLPIPMRVSYQSAYIPFMTAFAAIVSHSVYAQELEISVSPSPVGSGARAAGMADAFVAVADDATAASWNPAGLVQLEAAEIAFVGAYNNVFETLSADYHPEVDRMSSAHNVDVNFLSFTYPLKALVLGRNVTVGLYYQHKYDFTRDFVLNLNSSNRDNGAVLSQYEKLDFQQRGGVSTITPAVAFEATKRLSFGIAVNFYRSTFLSDNSWEQTLHRRELSRRGPTVKLLDVRTREKYEDFRGENVTLGMLWSIDDRWSVGARWDSAFTGEADFKSQRLRRELVLLGDGPPRLSSRMNHSKREIRFPNTYAVGVSARINDRLTLSADVTRTDWNDFWFRGPDRDRISLINAENLDAAGDTTDFKETYTIRLGGEYVFIPKQPKVDLNRLWSMRAGVFYDQEPASKDPDDFWGLTFGVGVLANQRINIDAAIQVRYGKGVNADFIRGISGFNEDVIQGRFVLSTVIYF